jgi:hypothetical protein
MHIISASASRTRAVFKLQRMRQAQAVICSSWRLLMKNLERIAGHSFVSIRCMMSMPFAGREAWFKGVLAIDSLHQTLEFTRGSSSVSALHARIGPVKVHFGDDDSISFKCILTEKGEDGASRYFDVHINFNSSSSTFRCDNALDAAHVEACLLSHLLFRTMISHHDQRPISSLGSDSSSAPANGAHYLRTRLRLLRKIRLFEAFKTSLGLSTAGSPQASQAGPLHRKLDSRAKILVSWAHLSCAHEQLLTHTAVEPASQSLVGGQSPPAPSR